MFDKIRIQNKEKNLKKEITNTIFVCLLGIILGVFSKWLDNLAIDDSIWYLRLIGSLNLNTIFSEFGIWLFIGLTIAIYSKTPIRSGINVFVFFLGMTISYHLYTIIFSGFNPFSYMLIWYGITIVSPIIGYICWYAKGDNKISLIISSLILLVMFNVSFGIGLWYFDIKSIIDIIIFIATIIVLYIKPKNSIINILAAIILSYLFCMIKY